jgi:hypothetical protein
MQNLDFNVPGGKLNRGLSVVDSVEILRGRGLTDDEYFKVALLGWCIELVRPSSRVLASRLDVRRDAAASLFPRLRRHHGPVDHAPRTVVLVPRRRRGQHRDQRRAPARRGHLSCTQEAFPRGVVLRASARVVSRRAFPMGEIRDATDAGRFRRRFKRGWVS